MPRFAANLSFLFREVPFLDRFQAASEAGFDAVEVLFPYDDAAHEITRRLTMYGQRMILINTPPPNWTGGERGFAAVPGGQKRFRHDLTRAMRFAQALQVDHLHVMAGKSKGLVARKTFVDNLSWAAAEFPDRSLTIEPINPVDMPGYFLNNFDQAAEIVAEVGAPNLGLQFDAYHAQMITHDMPATWEKHRDLVRHIQVGGTPGRHEPIRGEIDYPAWFRQLDAEGYDGFVSGEYHPTAQTEAGLIWLTDGLEGS
ncbi:TIM barrel protein [Aliiroseovarius subalbicans]|uniref:hydroxypyruvate isomerase family protein n=1 Tax=Aliiroseovarius subalbicans TaxID=2925840 RepID=UPI001F59C149|nr:TIM barrel protein [Aliiroseovarius subalbicans]MCI2400723.1 TIM barrel protein [Aliiroseovarius subalbicans]